jgi:cellobiose-specific phosphotransferase system component IIA
MEVKLNTGDVTTARRGWDEWLDKDDRCVQYVTHWREIAAAPLAPEPPQPPRCGKLYTTDPVIMFCRLPAEHKGRCDPRHLIPKEDEDGSFRDYAAPSPARQQEAPRCEHGYFRESCTLCPTCPKCIRHVDNCICPKPEATGGREQKLEEIAERRILLENDARLRAELDGAKKRIANVEAAFDKAEAELTRLSRDNSGLQNTNEALRLALSRVSGERDAAQSALCDYTDMLQNARDRNEAAEAERDEKDALLKLVIAAGDARSALVKAVKDREAAEAERDALENRAVLAEDDVRIMLLQLANANKSRVTTEEAQEAAESALARWKAEAEKAGSYIAKQDREYDELESELARLKQALRDIADSPVTNWEATQLATIALAPQPKEGK